MNKKQSPSQKKRGATVAAVLCFVAAIAIVGTYTLGNSREARQNEEIARTEENETKDNITEDSADDAREADSAVIDNQNEDKTQGCSIDRCQLYLYRALEYYINSENPDIEKCKWCYMVLYVIIK